MNRDGNFKNEEHRMMCGALTCISVAEMSGRSAADTAWTLALAFIRHCTDAGIHPLDTLHACNELFNDPNETIRNVC